MRAHGRLPTALFAATMGLGFPGTPAAQPAGSVVRIEVVDPGDTHVGTAFAIAEAGGGDSRTVSFVTAARLFALHTPHRARLFLPDRTVEVGHNDVFVPGDEATGVAVLRIRTPDPRVTSVPTVYTPAGVGQAFVISGPAVYGLTPISTGHIGAATTRVLWGDRILEGMRDCLGAPVSHEGRVFALVTSCEAAGLPTFAPFAAVRSFLKRHAPGLAERPSPTPRFVMGSATAHVILRVNCISQVKP